jgi:hypothetical protein
MAGGTINLTQSSYSGTYIDGEIVWSSVYNAAGYCDVTAKLHVIKGNTDITLTQATYGTWPYTLTINGNSATGTSEAGTGVLLDWVLIATKTVRVSSLEAGFTGSIAISGSVTAPTGTSYEGHKTIGSGIAKINADISASAPTVGSDIVQMGRYVIIDMNPSSTSFTHTLTYSFGGTTGTIATGVRKSCSWQVPKSLAYYTGNQISGICTIICKTYSGTVLIGEESVQVELLVPKNTVPSLSASSIVLGDSITISTPREVDCYEHWITYKLTADGSSVVAFSGALDVAVQESYEWTPSLSLLAPKIPSATKGTITITCETRFKDSTTIVGISSVSFSVTVPDNSTTQPKVSMTLVPVDSPFEGIYVAGRSRVKVSYDASSDYSTIVSYETNILSETGNTNPYTSEVFMTAASFALTGKVTDARGYSTTVRQTVRFVDYSAPRITPGSGKSSIVCVRCNSDGKVDPGGVYLLIQIGRKYSKVLSGGVQRNYCKLSFQWKTDAQDNSAFSDPVELLSRTATSDYVSTVLPGVVTSNTTAYSIRLIAEDDAGGKETATVVVPTAFVTFHSPIGGHGFTLGGYHDPAKYDVFDCLFDAEFQGDVSGRVLGLGKLPEIPANANANDYKDFGTYSVLSNAIASTLTNFPSAKAGTFRVWSANGSGGKNYIMQEYIVFDNSGTFRRSVMLNGDVWEYGAWK